MGDLGVSNFSNVADEARRVEERRAIRMKKNRENAALSRIRKKQQLEALEETVRSLAKQNTELNVFVQRLAAENFLLRDHLAEVSGLANVAVPDVPSVLDEVWSRAVRGDDVEAGRTTMTMTPPPPLTTTTTTMKKTATTKRKRGGLSSGATTAFLALFSLFLFASPTAFLGGNNDDASSSSPALAGLPAVSSVVGPLGTTDFVGRGLKMTAEFEDTETGEMTTTMSDLVSKTIDALLHDQAALPLPKHALEVAKDMAPSALALDDGTTPTTPPSLPAASFFPALADRFFSNSGLEPPQTCKKVFEFTPDDLPSPINKKSVEKYVLGTAVGFKGSSSGLRVSESSPSSSEDVEVVADPPTQSTSVVLPTTSKTSKTSTPTTVVSSDLPTPTSPSVVSVLFPTPRNASGTEPSSTAGLAAVDELYVVVLNPQSTFTTYACPILSKGALIV